MKHIRVSKGLAERARKALLPDDFDQDVIQAFFEKGAPASVKKGKAMAALLEANEKAIADLIDKSTPLEDYERPEIDIDYAYAKGGKGGRKTTSDDDSGSTKGGGRGKKNKDTTEDETPVIAPDTGDTDTGGTDTGGTDTSGTDTGGTGTGGTDTGGETNTGSDDPNVYVSGLDTPDGFNIEVGFEGDWTNEMKQVMYDVVEEISDIIVGDIPSYGGIDDISLRAIANYIDGGGGYLGVGGTLKERPDTYLPYEGFIRVDTADAQTQLDRGTFRDVVYHEVMHSLGFGTIWQEQGLIKSVNGEDRFVGENAILAYNNVFSNIAEGDAESWNGIKISSDRAHWDHKTFTTEIMTTTLYFSGNYTSDMTIASLEDLGYDTVFEPGAYSMIA
ncbi:MAG: leishmanolysin-related zinc metalloendopeptidase [Arenibacterium sp.]